MGQLKLAGMRAAYDEVLAAGCARSTVRASSGLLLAQLADNRARSTAIAWGWRTSRWMKNLAEFDFTVSPGHQGLVRELHEGGFLATQRNAVLMVEPAPAVASGHRHRRQFCRAQRRARAFFHAVDLVNQLRGRGGVPESQEGWPTTSSASISSSSTSSAICRSRSSGGQMLFHLISRLYERTSVVLSTNLTFAEWPTVSPTPR